MYLEVRQVRNSYIQCNEDLVVLKINVKTILQFQSFSRLIWLIHTSRIYKSNTFPGYFSSLIFLSLKYLRIQGLTDHVSTSYVDLLPILYIYLFRITSNMF